MLFFGLMGWGMAVGLAAQEAASFDRLTFHGAPKPLAKGAQVTGHGDEGAGRFALFRRGIHKDGATRAKHQPVIAAV